MEVVATGAADAVDALGRWLERGPPQARVDAVVREAVVREAVDPTSCDTDFDIG